MDKIICGPEDFSVAVQTYRFDRRIAAERISMARASRIITSTEQEKTEQYSHRLYRGAVEPADRDTFAVIPPGVNLDIFGWDRKSKTEEQVACRVRELLDRDIPPERRDLPAVICSSRLDRKKNHLGLIRAWVESEELRGSANLVIVTRGVRDPLRTWKSDLQGEERGLFEQIVRQIHEGGLQGCVSAFDLNSQEELAACYRYLSRERRGIFALSSLYEPFGLAPLEAMAAGLPAVVTGNGGPRESLRDNGCEYGLLFEPEDPPDIARAILRLARDNRFWREMQQRGRRRVQERYTWPRTALGYLDEFERILKGADAANRSFTLSGENGPSWLRKLYYESEGSR